jgi:hypothetical protein
MGVSKLVDLLQDEREVIRNDVSFMSKKMNIIFLFLLGTSPLANINTFEREYTKNSCI